MVSQSKRLILFGGGGQDIGKFAVMAGKYLAASGCPYIALKSKNIALTVDIAPDAGRFIADARRIRQILINLLSNAIGFSEDRRRIHISARRVGDSMEFAIADEGAGAILESPHLDGLEWLNLRGNPLADGRLADGLRRRFGGRLRL